MGFRDVGRPKAEIPSEGAEAPDGVQQFLRWGVELERAVAESVAGVMLRGARPVAVGITQGATKNPSLSPSSMVGFSLTNKSDEDDVTVRVLFRDGFDAQADTIMEVTLAPGESAREWMYPGISLQNGLFVDADGPISGSVYMRGSD